jgi:hypothetical protein
MSAWSRHQGGGKVTFAGRDPIIGSPLPLATMASRCADGEIGVDRGAVALSRRRSQNLSVNLGQALHRLCPFYDRKWELLNGYPPGNPADPNNPFMPTHMYATRDGRRMLFEGQPAIYLRTQLEAFSTGARHNDIGEQMRDIARRMTAAEIAVASEFYSERP